MCLAGDTLVQTPYGNKPIKDIKAGDEVLSFNLDTHQVEIDIVAKSWMTSPNRKVMKITFDTGQELICTPNHPIGVRMLNRDKLGRIIKINGSTESVDFVRADQLVVGDRIKSNYIETSLSPDTDVSKMESLSTKWCMNSITEAFQKVTSSIIVMKIN